MLFLNFSRKYKVSDKIFYQTFLLIFETRMILKRYMSEPYTRIKTK